MPDREQYDILLAENIRLKATNEFLQFELDKLKRLIFGSKSERFVPSDPGQLSLDLGQEPVTPPEVTTEQVSYSRSKTEKREGHGRPPLPEIGRAHV